MRCLFFWILGVVSFSCHETGEEATTRFESTAPFYILELNSVFDVYLVQDTIFGVRISAHEDIIHDIHLKLDTGILRIENNSRIKWSRPETNKVALYIHADRLTTVLPTETCYIKSLTPMIADYFEIIMGHHPKLSIIDLELNCNSFRYWNNHQCGGKVTLRGSSDHVVIQSYALMTVDASQLTASTAYIENNSKGDCSVRVTDKIDYSISGVGNIYLYGNPSEVIPHEVTSSGILIEMD